ncbi:uncharacterized protein LOC143470765 isoform X3 [Clavelina lepadiformis]|uniref:uncharacterized protein LOC143470765 isoform X3 n=1 Tax=Clavelina lepadiformis TaxID=159417 RepID=UPI00404256B9
MMNFDEDDISEALSAAVGAHFQQFGDLRNEISGASYIPSVRRHLGRRQFSAEEINAAMYHRRFGRPEPSTYSAGLGYNASNSRYAYSLRSDHGESLLHLREKERPPDRPDCVRLDERHVYHAPRSPSPSSLMRPTYSYSDLPRRQVHYDRNIDRPSYRPSLPEQEPPAPFHQRPPSYSNHHMNDLRPILQSSLPSYPEISRRRLNANTLAIEPPREKRSRRDEPVATLEFSSTSNVSKKYRRKEYSKPSSRIPVVREDESFDKILKQHKRKQRAVPFDKSKGKEIAHAIRQRREQKSDYPGQREKSPIVKVLDNSTIELDGKRIPVMLIKDAIKNFVQPLNKTAVTNSATSSERDTPDRLFSKEVQFLSMTTDPSHDAEIVAENEEQNNVLVKHKLKNVVLDKRSTSVYDEHENINAECEPYEENFHEGDSETLPVKISLSEQDENNEFKKEKLGQIEVGDKEKDIKGDVEVADVESKSGIPLHDVDVNQAAVEKDSNSLFTSEESNQKLNFASCKTNALLDNAAGEVINVENLMAIADANQKEDGKQEDEDDEELLNLRLVALSSAYNRNVDIVNDEYVTPDQRNSTKAKKKKKQNKSEKKYNAKETSFATTYCSSKLKSSKATTKDSVESSMSGSSQFSIDSIIDKVLMESRKKLTSMPSDTWVSPPRDLSDPKVLTLGEEIMREKAKQEKVILRELRNLEDNDQSCKIFMHILNEQQQKLKRKKTQVNEPKVQTSSDNYDEIDMDLDDLNDEDPEHPPMSPPPLPPLPPGTDDYDAACTSINQESIWELLDQPLGRNEDLSAEESMAPLAAAITEAITQPLDAEEEEYATESPSSPMPDDALIRNTSSPFEFQHAFDPTVVSDPFPAMATDLSYATSSMPIEEEKSSGIELDKDIQSSVPVPLDSLSERKLEKSVKNIVGIGEDVKSEDEDEMRKELLQTIARKPKVNKVQGSTKPGLGTVQQQQPQSFKDCLVNESSESLSTVPTNLGSDKELSKLQQSVGLSTEQPNDFTVSTSTLTSTIPSQQKVFSCLEEMPVAEPVQPVGHSLLQETRSKLKTMPDKEDPCRQVNSNSKLPLNKFAPKKKRRRGGKRRRKKILKSVLKSGLTRTISNEHEVIAISSTATTAATEEEKPVIVKPPSASTSSASTTSTWSKAISNQDFKPSTSEEKRSVLEPTTSCTVSSNNSDQKIVEVVSKTTTSITEQVQLSKVKPTSTSKGLRAGTIVDLTKTSYAQHRLSHPPVVINLISSSDEENDKHGVAHGQNMDLSNDLNTVIKRLRAQSSKSMKSDNLNSTKKTIVKDEKPSLKPDTGKLSTMNNNAVQKTIVQPFNISAENVATVVSPGGQQNAATKDYVECDTKLKRVRELLQRDRAVVSRLRQQKQLKQQELETIKKEIQDFKNKILFAEKKFAESKDIMEKINTNAAQVVNRMKQRQKLEDKYLHKIKELKTEIQKEKSFQPLHHSSNIDASGTSSRITGKNQQALPPSKSTIVASQPKADNEKIVKHNELHKKLKHHRHKGLKEEADKNRELAIQREKARLQHMEMKLKMIKKHNAERASHLLKSEKVNHQMGKHNFSTKSLKQKVTFKSTNPVPKMKTSEKAMQSMMKVQTTNNSVGKASTKINTQSPALISSLETLKYNAGSQSNIKTTESSNSNKADQNDSTPVTPSLKRRRTSSTGAASAVFQDSEIATSSKKEKRKQDLPILSGEKLKKFQSSVLPKILAKHWTNVDAEELVEQNVSLQVFCIPECLSKWKFDPGEVVQPSNQMLSNAPRYELSERPSYESPLRYFRSYRLSQFYCSHENLRITSQTFSHKINPHQILCRYALTGKCHDSSCRAQHLSDTVVDRNEIYLDLLSYCPTLIKSADGNPVQPSDPLDVQLKAAEATVENLCSSRNSKTGPRSVEETCHTLSNLINRALGSKNPYTTVFNRRNFGLKSSVKNVSATDDDEDSEADVMETDENGSLEKEATSHLTGAEDSEYRYYEANDKHRSDIERLNVLLGTKPKDEAVRIKLAQAYFKHSRGTRQKENHDFIKLALHTLCIGIEENDQSEALWSTYIPMLRQLHDGDTCHNQDELLVLDQVVILLPLSKCIWDEVFKWNWSLEKLLALYQQLTENLMTRKDIWSAEENLENAPAILEFDYYSSWLVQVVAEHTHLLLSSKGKADAKIGLQTVLRNLSDLKKNASAINDFFPLRQSHMCSLWLIYIHLMEFGKLPATLYDQSLSSHMFGMRTGITDVIIPFKSSRKLSQPPQKLRAFFKASLQSCSFNNDSAQNSSALLPIYSSFIKFEASLDNWEEVATVCEKLLNVYNSSENYEDEKNVWLLWTDLFIQSQNTTLVTQVFDRAVTRFPESAELAYKAAIYQINCESRDLEAAMTYLESCISALVDLEGREGLSIVVLYKLYKQLLKHDACLKTAAQLKLRDGVTTAQVEREKTYLWLSYCLLTNLLQQSDFNSTEKSHKVPDLYETAIHSVSSVEDRKTIWLYYILHLRSTATAVSAAEKTSVADQRQQIIWFKRFTSIVRRCLQSMPCVYHSSICSDNNVVTGKPSYSDYTFHNQVVSIYLECFTNGQASVAFSMLTDLMPANLPLVSRVAADYLKVRDNTSTSSLLWRITSSFGSKERCCYAKLWKMAVAAHCAEGRHLKALRICQRALMAKPRCKELWHDAAALALAYGDRKDLDKMNSQCQLNLGINIPTLLKGILQ